MTDTSRFRDADASRTPAGRKPQRKPTLRERIARSRAGAPAASEPALAADLPAGPVPDAPAGTDDAAAARDIAPPRVAVRVALRRASIPHRPAAAPDRPVIQPQGFDAPAPAAARIDTKAGDIALPVPVGAAPEPAGIRHLADTALPVPARSRLIPAAAKLVRAQIALGSRRRTQVRRIAAAAAGVAMFAGVGTAVALLLSSGDESAGIHTAQNAPPAAAAGDTSGTPFAVAGAASQQDGADDGRLGPVREAVGAPVASADPDLKALAADGVVAPDPGSRDPALTPAGTDRMAFATELLPAGDPWAAVRAAAAPAASLTGGRGSENLPAPPMLVRAPGEPGEAVRARVDATFAAIAGAPALAPEELGLDGPAPEPESAAAEEAVEAETVPVPPPAPEREKVRTAAREQRVAPRKTAERPAAARQARAVRAVNMRARPRNGATTITIVPGGSRLDVVGCDHWCRVIYNGKEGYVYKRFVSGT